MDTITFIIKYESGECTYDEIVEGFQNLLNTGTIRKLQGSYHRMANHLLENGDCYVPTKFEEKLTLVRNLIKE